MKAGRVNTINMFLFPLPLLLMELARYFIKVLISQMQTTSGIIRLGRTELGKVASSHEFALAIFSADTALPLVYFYILMGVLGDCNKKKTTHCVQ